MRIYINNQKEKPLMVGLTGDLKYHSTVSTKTKDLFITLKKVYLKDVSEKYCYYTSKYSYSEMGGTIKFKYIGQVEKEEDAMSLIAEYFI